MTPLVDAARSHRPPLRQMQQSLQGYLLGEASRIIDAIVDAPPLPAADRLAIYGNAYRVRLIEALDDTYPVMHSVLGDEVFAAMGEQFVAAHPSVHRSIRWYGSELADFLRRTAPFAEQPILKELAELEWTLTEVFHAADAKPVQRAALAAIDPAAWSRLTFTMHPSLRRLQFTWNTAAVWQAMSRDESPPDPVAVPEPVPWRLWRLDYQNYFRSMTPAETAALDAAQLGATFAEMCEALSAWLPDEQIPLHAAEILAAWADGGMIVGVTPTGASSR